MKANIGHVEGGSGLAAIVKAILMLEKGIIPPNALFETLNPRIDAGSYNLHVGFLCCLPPILIHISHAARFLLILFLGQQTA